MSGITYALAKAHSKNIDRYHRLLNTRLSDLERNYIESRLLTETAALRAIEANKDGEERQVSSV